MERRFRVKEYLLFYENFGNTLNVSQLIQTILVIAESKHNQSFHIASSHQNVVQIMVQIYSFARKLLQLGFIYLFIYFTVFCGSPSVQRDCQSGLLTDYAFHVKIKIQGLCIFNLLNCHFCNMLRVKYRIYQTIYIQNVWV